MWYLGRYADDMYLYDYDYSWLDDTYTIVNYTNRLRNVTYNNDGSVIDIKEVLNGINDETILVWYESFLWECQERKKISFLAISKDTMITIDMNLLESGSKTLISNGILKVT